MSNPPLVYDKLFNQIIDRTRTLEARSRALQSYNTQLINGGLEIWQRGAGPHTGSTYNADGWVSALVGGSTLSISRNSLNADSGSQYCAELTYVHAVTSTWLQKLEHWVELRTRHLSISARVRASVTVGIRVGIDDGISAISYSDYHTGGNTYETLVVTHELAAGATRAHVVFSLEKTGVYYIDNIYCTQAQGAMDYVPHTIQEVIANCERYYTVVEHHVRFIAGGADVIHNGVRWHTKMAGVPTVVITPGTRVNVSSVALANASESGVNYQITATGAGACSATSEIITAKVEL